jgi:hypothetical protein
LAEQVTPLHPLKHWSVSLQMKVSMTLLSTPVSIYLLIHSDFSRESDTKLTDRTGIKAFVDLVCLAGVLRSTRSLEELWDTEGDGITSKKFRVVMNQNRFRFLIRCIFFNKSEIYP